MLRLFRWTMLVVSGLFICPLQADVFLVSDENGILWDVDPVSGIAEQVGDMGIVMTDIAFSPSGELFGISAPDDLYLIDFNEHTPGNPEMVPSTLIGSLGIASRGPIGRRDVFSLEFDSEGTLFFATFAPFVGGELGTINPLTAEPDLVGVIGFNNGGDLAFAPDGRLFMNETPPSGLLLAPNRTRSNKLIEIDPLTGEGTLVGSIGFRNVFGMDFVGDGLFGHTLQGEFVSIDTATGAGTLMPDTNPAIVAYGASFTDVLVLTPQPQFKSHLPRIADVNNLVLIAHGWNTLFPQEGEMWIDDMAQDIRTYIDTNRPDADDWEVVPYDWRYLAGSHTNPIRPGTALTNAIALGVLEGKFLATFNYEHVHLIGNSAGAALVDKIADYIKAASPSTKVHVTFLDAYAPGIFAGSYGDSADWADQYFNRGDSLWLDWTEKVLPHAHNVDVTQVNPSPSSIPFKNHSWPHEFYQESLVSQPEFEGYGFLLSREATIGEWNPEATYSTDTEVVLNPPAQPSPRPEPRIRFDNPLDFATLPAVSSSTGIAQADNLTLTLQIGSPVWYVVDLTVTEPINFLTMDIEFTSDLGAEGLLAVYFDNQVIGLIDERFVFDGAQPHQFYLGEAEAGLHKLGFRLDPFTDVSSSVVISNVTTGLAEVPEPSIVVLLVIGGMSAVFFRRMHGRVRY